MALDESASTRANNLAVIPSHNKLYQFHTIDVFVRTAIKMHLTSVKK